MSPVRTHLVAGAAGFLGSHLVDSLLARGDRVIGVDNLLTGREANLAEALQRERFTFLPRDVTEPLDVDGPVDYVWNLASPASPPEYLKHPIATLRTGAVGTENLLRLAKARGARFLLASTSEVYGDPEVTPQTEDYWGHVNPVGPRSVYDEAKRYAEALTMAYRRHEGVDTVIIRIFNTYGPRMRLDDGRVVPTLVGQALRGEPLTVYGDGTQTRSFCYVEDEIEGIYRAMMRGIPGPVNLGNPREMTILQFAEAVRRVAGRDLALAFRPLPQDDPRQRRPDIALARRELAWEPRIPIEEGLRRTYEHYRKLGAPPGA